MVAPVSHFPVCIPSCIRVEIFDYLDVRAWIFKPLDLELQQLFTLTQNRRIAKIQQNSSVENAAKEALSILKCSHKKNHLFIQGAINKFPKSSDRLIYETYFHRPDLVHKILFLRGESVTVNCLESALKSSSKHGIDKTVKVLLKVSHFQRVLVFSVLSTATKKGFTRTARAIATHAPSAYFQRKGKLRKIFLKDANRPSMIRFFLKSFYPEIEGVLVTKCYRCIREGRIKCLRFLLKEQKKKPFLSPSEIFRMIDNTMKRVHSVPDFRSHLYAIQSLHEFFKTLMFPPHAVRRAYLFAVSIQNNPLREIIERRFLPLIDQKTFRAAYNYATSIGCKKFAYFAKRHIK